MANKNKKLLLIDANSFIHRSFHALPPLEKDGKPTGAIYGLANTLMKILRDKQPQYVAACYDTPEKTFRKEMFEEYKAHRPEAPDELIDQIKESYNLFEGLGVKTMEKDGFEADDVIGTLTEKFKNEKNLDILILTGDLDTLQLIENGNIVVLTPKRGVSNMKTYDKKAVEERFGVPPEKLPDYKGLVGDSSDNIPGVPGIGKKTAEKILKKYGSLEKACKQIEKEEELDHRSKKLIENKEQAKLSKKLGTINKEVPIEIKIKELAYETDKEKLLDYFQKMKFNSLVKRLKNPKEVKDLKENKKDLLDNSLIISNIEEVNKKDLESDKLKISYNWKSKIKKIGLDQIKGPLFDIKIAGWILDPDEKDLSLENLSEKYLNKKSQLFTSEKERKNLIKDLFILFHHKIEEKGLEKPFYKMDIPLIKILVHMEEAGIKINKNKLEDLEKKISKKIESLEKKIYKKADKEFNINSPQQVGEVLFDDLKIESAGKTSSGQYKTSENVLKEISKEHKIADFILEYRQFSKIENTYVKPLIETADENSEIHTTFLQTSTATGRLSSEEPNMQNVPKGSQWANNLRKSFESRKGFSLLSFDYSQLELRLFAHISGDENLKGAFKEGKDIHSLTASKVMDKSIDEITESERDLAKTLNFGVVFGMGSRAFSKQSGMTVTESKEFIDKYFEDFPDVKKWQNKIKEEASVNGFVKNENGRIRYIKSGGAMDRAAINMPLQSLGADIIKTAMIKTYEYFKNQNILDNKARILLSIHDELLLEVSDDILKKTASEVKKILENECDDISVPLTVEAKKGKNWGQLNQLKI